MESGGRRNLLLKAHEYVSTSGGGELWEIKLLKLSPERKVIAASEQSDRNPSNT